MSSKNSTAATLLTLAVGTIVGVLIAPASGRDTRRKIMEKGTGAKDTLHYLVMEAGELVDQLRSIIGNFQIGNDGSDGQSTSSSRQTQTSSYRNS